MKQHASEKYVAMIWRKYLDGEDSKLDLLRKMRSMANLYSEGRGKTCNGENEGKEQSK